MPGQLGPTSLVLSCVFSMSVMRTMSIYLVSTVVVRRDKQTVLWNSLGDAVGLLVTGYGPRYWLLPNHEGHLSLDRLLDTLGRKRRPIRRVSMDSSHHRSSIRNEDGRGIGARFLHRIPDGCKDGLPQVFRPGLLRVCASDDVCSWATLIGAADRLEEEYHIRWLAGRGTCN